MYVSNKTLVNAVLGVCCSGVLGGGVYLTANSENVARWKENTFYSCATEERASSTRQMMTIVSGRVETMSPDELRQTAEQCEELYDEIVSQYTDQVRELGNRRLTRDQQHEVTEVLSGLDDKLEERHD